MEAQGKTWVEACEITLKVSKISEINQNCTKSTKLPEIWENGTKFAK